MIRMEIPNIVFAAVIIVLTGLLAVSIITSGYSGITGFLTSEQAAQKVINYLDEIGYPATLVDVEEVSGVYKVNIEIEEEILPIYVSKDGSLMFPQAIEIELESYDAPNSQKPVVKFFVMSYCPFGQQAEYSLEQVADLFGDKVEFEPHYVISKDSEGNFRSLHKENELNEDVRQICIWNNYESDIWWDYVSYVNDNIALNDIESEWKNAANKFNIDTDLIESCVSQERENILNFEFELNNQYGVTASPTIFINDELYTEGRDPESIKEGICTGFTTQPAECSQTLSTNSEAASGSCD